MASPVFVLCPLRSYSSLFSTMLGQHPDLYGMPELNLFKEHTLAELLKEFRRSSRPHSKDGLLRALAQLHDGEQTDETVQAAADWVDQRESWTSKKMLDYVFGLVDPLRPIEKSPANVMVMGPMRRMDAWYPDAFYIHLTRHPRSNCNSIAKLKEKYQLETDAPASLDRVDPEVVWNLAHRNILEFLEGIPEERYCRVKGEKVLANINEELPPVLEMMGCSTDQEAVDAVLHPELSPYAVRGPKGALYGNDPNFLEGPRFDATRIKEPLLEGGLDWASGREFTQRTATLAKEFGYR